MGCPSFLLSAGERRFPLGGVERADRQHEVRPGQSEAARAAGGLPGRAGWRGAAQIPLPGLLPLPGGHPSRQGPESAGRAWAQCRFLLSGLPGMDGSAMASSLQADTAACPELAGSSASVVPSLVLPRSGAGERAGPRACAPGGNSGSACGARGALVAQWGWPGLGDRGAGVSLSQLSGGGRVTPFPFDLVVWPPRFLLHVLAARLPEAPPLGSVQAGRKQASLVHKGLSLSRSPVRMSHLIWARRPPFLEGTVLTPWVSPSDGVGGLWSSCRGGLSHGGRPAAVARRGRARPEHREAPRLGSAGAPRRCPPDGECPGRSASFWGCPRPDQLLCAQGSSFWLPRASGSFLVSSRVILVQAAQGLSWLTPSPHLGHLEALACRLPRLHPRAGTSPGRPHALSEPPQLAALIRALPVSPNLNRTASGFLSKRSAARELGLRLQCFSCCPCPSSPRSDPPLLS